MGIYIYQHPKSNKTIELVQNMNEPHEYIDNKGIKWNRVFTVPQGAVSTKLDPFNSRQYIDKIGSNKGKVGDAWDRSAELSERRAEKAGGVDPIKTKYLDDYAKRRKGKRHPKEIQDTIKNKTWTV